MSNNQVRLSNLTIKANIASSQYQDEFVLLSVFELRDVRDRMPLLGISLNPSSPAHVTNAQMVSWKRHLFWGDQAVSMDERRQREWVEALAEALEEAVDSCGANPEEERALELLIITEILACKSSTYRERANELSARLKQILKRHEFGYSDERIRDRLEIIMGNSQLAMETGNVNGSHAYGGHYQGYVSSIPADDI